MYLQHLIDRYKSVRKKKYLNQPAGYRHQYAFIGAGQHSTGNLYPAIHYLGIPLKKICTADASNARKMAARFSGCTGADSMNDILNDAGIKGVFVAAPPRRQFTIVKQLLAAQKHVFVEKPPCFSAGELDDLMNTQGTYNCLTGLQKRFGAITGLLQPHLPKASTYTCSYLTGPYPEGDAVFELFIHPVDNLIQLFGEVEQVHITVSQKNRQTCFLLLTHKNGVTGTLHLSTDYSWQCPVDELEINTTSAILKANYPYKLEGIEKPSRFLNIPLEKIFKSPVVKKVYLNNNGFIPVGSNNSIAMQGFLGEIEYFAKTTEENRFDQLHNLQSLVATYRLLEQVKKHFS